MDPILSGELYCTSPSESSSSQTLREPTGVLKLICNGYTTIRGALISQEILERLDLITCDIRLCI